MIYHPVRDNIKVVKVEREEEKIGSFIYATAAAPKNNLTLGLVEEVGKGYTNAHGVNVVSRYSPGDIVVFKLHNQVDEVLEKGKVKFILTSAEVIATAEKVESE